MKSLIVSGGIISDLSLILKYAKKSDLIIAADRGAEYLKKVSIVPDIVLGDFDSISTEIYTFYKLRKDVEILKYPAKKDMTDTEIAGKLALKKGAEVIYILGATGGRLDHFISNIYFLEFLLENNVEAFIIDEKNIITLIDKERELKTSKKDGWKLSLIPLTKEVSGVTTEGLLYSLKDATMKRSSSLGISNEFLGQQAKIRLSSGTLLVVISKDL